MRIYIAVFIALLQYYKLVLRVKAESFHFASILNHRLFIQYFIPSFAEHVGEAEIKCNCAKGNDTVSCLENLQMVLPAARIQTNSLLHHADRYHSRKYA